MLKNEMESYVRIDGDLKNVTYPYMGYEGGQKMPKSYLPN